jgi:hypothetical protein
VQANADTAIASVAIAKRFTGLRMEMRGIIPAHPHEPIRVTVRAFLQGVSNARGIDRLVARATSTEDTGVRSALTVLSVVRSRRAGAGDRLR